MKFLKQADQIGHVIVNYQNISKSGCGLPIRFLFTESSLEIKKVEFLV